MNLKGSQTEKNLEAAFAAESKARNAYNYYAAAAEKEGLTFISDAFLEIAKNEEEHARGHFEFLGKVRDTLANLETAVHGEAYEYNTIYPDFARTAREEGFPEIGEYFERMAEMESRHEKIIKNLINHLKERSTPKERTTGHSSITLVQVMLPDQGNPAGNVHGGEIMKMMDTAAGVVAARHAHSNVVTAKVEELKFLRPVHIGELVFAHARPVFVGSTSIEIRVEVEAENLVTEERHKALTAYFIYVALDRSGKPITIPPFSLPPRKEKGSSKKDKKGMRPGRCRSLTDEAQPGQRASEDKSGATDKPFSAARAVDCAGHPSRARPDLWAGGLAGRYTEGSAPSRIRKNRDRCPLFI